jgi:hypothetical protein
MSVITHPLSIRIGQWIAGRHGPESGAVLLDRRRVYNLPTKPGLLFGAAMLVLLIGSINYSLQLGYMLTFLVTSMAVVGMHTTHSNLAQIVLRGVRVEPVFAGDVAVFLITAANPTTADRFALRFSFAEPTVSNHWLSVLRHRAEPMTAISTAVPARGDRSIGVPLPAPVRGRLQAPRIVIETRYPFGLWRAWAYLTPALTAMVYPAPEADAPALPATDSAGVTVSASRLPATICRRAAVQPGRPAEDDRLAPGAQRRTFGQAVRRAGRRRLLLDFDSLPRTMDVERKLSRLARWVLDADAAHMRYGLRCRIRWSSPAAEQSIAMPA